VPAELWGNASSGKGELKQPKIANTVTMQALGIG
jgi:hypothetical protein